MSIKSNWNETSRHLFFCTFELLNQPPRSTLTLYSAGSVHMLRSYVAHAELRAFLASVRGHQLQKEALARGWPLMPRLHYYTSKSPLIAAPLKATDEPSQRHQINRRSMRSHLAASLALWHQLCSASCVSERTRERERSCSGLMLLNSGGRD